MVGIKKMKWILLLAVIVSYLSNLILNAVKCALNALSTECVEFFYPFVEACVVLLYSVTHVA